MRVPKDLQDINFNYLTTTPIEEYLSERELYLLLYVLANKALPHPDNYLFQLPYYSLLKCNWAFCVWSRTSSKQPQKPLSTQKYLKKITRELPLGILYAEIYPNGCLYPKKTIEWAKKQASLEKNYKELETFANKYIEAYAKGKLKTNERILTFLNSQQEVCAYLIREQKECGDTFPITNNDLKKGTKFYEVLLSLYLTGFIKFEEIGAEDKFIKIHILRPLPINQYLGIILTSDNEFYYNGKVIPIKKPSKEFKLLKALIEGQGKADKAQFAITAGYRISSRNRKTKVNDLRSFRNDLSSMFKTILGKFDKQNRFKISQLGTNITLTLRRK